MKWNKIIEEKIFDSVDKLVTEVEQWKANQDTIVFTNGCFDILHLGHMDYLAKAADLGNRLVVGVNTDSSVQAIKGEDRPVIHEETRLYKLASLIFVDAVILFDEQTPLMLITAVKPDILVKGGDYTIETIVGAKETLTRGGKVEVISFLPGHSTTSIIQKIAGTKD